MNFKLLDNTKDIGEAFINRFIMSWEEFQVELKDFIAEMEKKNHPVDMTFYEQLLFWDRMSRNFSRVPMAEALAFLREHSGPVLFMGEKGEDGYHRGRRVVDFIAEADVHVLAKKIEQEWYDSYRLAEQNTYDANAILPSDLYVFDSSIKWCVVFTHETYWESELNNPIKATRNRYCIVCEV